MPCTTREAPAGAISSRVPSPPETSAVVPSRATAPSTPGVSATWSSRPAGRAVPVDVRVASIGWDSSISAPTASRELAMPVSIAVVRVIPTRRDAVVAAVRRGLRTALPVASLPAGPRNRPTPTPTRRTRAGTRIGPRSSTPAKKAAPPATIANVLCSNTATVSAGNADQPEREPGRDPQPAGCRAGIDAVVRAEGHQRTHPYDAARGQPGRDQRDADPHDERREVPAHRHLHGPHRSRRDDSLRERDQAVADTSAQHEPDEGTPRCR